MGIFQQLCELMPIGKGDRALTEDSTLKPPIPLGTTALPGATNLFLSSPFEHVFKGLAIEVRRRSVPRTSDGPALVYSG